MREDELREALRGTMAASPPPRPMTPTATIRAARRDRLRRLVAWALPGSAAAVAVIVVATVVWGAAGPGLRPGQQPTLLPFTGGDTEQPWPTGPDGKPQEDRTARAGDRFDKGVRVLEWLVAAVPDGYTAPTDPTPPNPNEGPGLRYHQAQFADRVNGTEVWEYMAIAAVAQGDGTGRVLAEVHTPGNTLPTGTCELAGVFWGMDGNCQVVTVGTTLVGVVTRQSGGDSQFEQWAAVRHPDGVVVFVAESVRFDDARPALAALPFSTEQLAALAADEQLHLT